ncbi:YdeI/OmpD-associated family protein [Thalassospira sp. CH_XMU1448-2]|uniref:YdeI/OmpD-associated family protein n=1 Tax=Thalassospira sp. CH_XMU1448-2 TaxID=3107773 RepID=UPI0030091FEC
MSSPADGYFKKDENWPLETARLREILLGCDLEEDLKWAKPCYTHDGKNIAIIQGMKDFLALMFFKGALMDDPANILVPPGPNSNSGRQIRFTSVDEVSGCENSIKSYIAAAIKIEQAGLKVEKSSEIDLPAELLSRLEQDSALKAAFEALTPGRQRGYGLYIGGAKQSATRMARIDKYRPKILEGKGIHDR